MDDVSLKEYVSAILEQRDHALKIALEAADLLERERLAVVTARHNALADFLIALAVERAKAVETTHEELNARIFSVRRELEAAGEAAKEAVTKAEIAVDKRLEGMNEFRAQLLDQTQTFLPRETFESVLTGWTAWRDQTDKRLNEGAGRQSGSSQVTERIFNVLALLIAVASIVVVLIVNVH